MWLQRYPVALEISAADRDKALAWLLLNHSKLDCKIVDLLGGAVLVRVRDEDAAVLDRLAERLG